MPERAPQLCDPAEIAEAARVEPEQVYLWMSEDKIPYADCGDGGFKIPLGGFLALMPDLVNLGKDLREQNARMRELNLKED